mgnify:CR=1 FL=1
MITPAASITPSTLDMAAQERAELREAAQAFEAIFVRRMLAAARATEFDKDGIFSGQGLEQFRTMQDELAGSRCVAILHDSGTRYLDTVFDDGWVETVLDVRPEELAHRINQPACVAS